LPFSLKKVVFAAAVFLLYWKKGKIKIFVIIPGFFFLCFFFIRDNTTFSSKMTKKQLFSG